MVRNPPKVSVVGEVPDGKGVKVVRVEEELTGNKLYETIYVAVLRRG
jgi:hypothetical protein